MFLRVVTFDQTRLAARSNIAQSKILQRGAIVAVPKNDKHKEYTRYAAHCLNMVTATKEQEARAIQREMAAEWLRLADAVLHPLRRQQSQQSQQSQMR
jgi:hypothetical protein